VVHLRPQRAETLPLGDAPAGVARGLGVGPADIDVDAGDLERSRAVDRKDAAVGSFQLRVDRTGNAQRECDQNCDENGPTEHSPVFWR
jgi:hypothetical protein